MQGGEGSGIKGGLGQDIQGGPTIVVLNEDENEAIERVFMRLLS
jgi:hypothetical protein